jgi:tripartite-type tricarboxylate transporter receptor subunit TctC
MLLFARALLAVFVLGGVSRAAHAQGDFPTHTVNIVVPIAPGSSTDVVARLVADRLSAIWKQPVVVQNISGGGQNIGAGRIAASPPDGYNLLVSPPPALTVNHLLYKQLSYQPNDFTPITVLVEVPNVLLVRKDFPAKTVQELIAYAKAHPGKVTFGSQGMGSTAHMTASRLEALAGIQLVHVPYRGEVPVLTDMMAGQIDMFFGTFSTALPLYRDGRLRILAVAQDKREADIPEVPTMAEAGIANFNSTAWYGLVAPPHTPAPLVDRINRDVVAILDEPEVIAKLKTLSLKPVRGTPGETAAFIKRETALWSKVLKDANVPMQ